jgi:hypothetical protein
LPLQGFYEALQTFLSFTLVKLHQLHQNHKGPLSHHQALRYSFMPSQAHVHTLLWWDYLEGGSKWMADCLDFDENFELGKI